MKKAIFLAIFLLSFSSAHGVQRVLMKNFTFVRNGGGHIEIVVFRSKNNEIKAQIKACGFIQLNETQQNSSSFTLKGQAAADAEAILNNQATLAANESFQSQYLSTGSWTSLELQYQIVDDNQAVNKRKIIAFPIVLIYPRISDVLKIIEEHARAKKNTSCNSGA
jgi:hypothetical protein